MSSVLSLITGAVRLLGAVAQGTPLPSGEAEDALTSLNSMLDSWNTQSLTVFTKNFNSYTLVPGQQSYTLGPTGNIQVAPQLRPTNIDRAQLRLMNVTPALELPIELLEDREWAQIRVKDYSAPIPNKLYSTGDFPNLTLLLWPVPSFPHQLVLWTWNQLLQITDLNSEISLPPGYERALRYNLAVEISSEYGLLPSPHVVQIASESLMSIKRLNAAKVTLDCDRALLSHKISGFNYMTGE